MCIQLLTTLQKPAVSGWAALEEFFKDLDRRMVNDFNDDINTLLTFVSLLCRVVTALLTQQT